MLAVISSILPIFTITCTTNRSARFPSPTAGAVIASCTSRNIGSCAIATHPRENLAAALHEQCQQRATHEKPSRKGKSHNYLNIQLLPFMLLLLCRLLMFVLFHDNSFWLACLHGIFMHVWGGWTEATFITITTMAFFIIMCRLSSLLLVKLLRCFPLCHKVAAEDVSLGRLLGFAEYQTRCMWIQSSPAISDSG